MAKLPHVTSNIPPDLRRYLDRTREAFAELEGVVSRGGSTTALLNQLSGLGGDLEQLLAGQYVTPPAPTGVLATGAFTAVILDWDVPTYRGHAYAEVWAAPAPVGGGVPPLGDAVLIGQTPGAVFTHYLGNAATRWYWVRFVNIVDQKGPFNAVDGTEASTAQDPSYLLSLLSGQITESELFSSLGDRINLIDGAASLTGSVAQRIATETSARTAAISSEQTARTNADSALATDITTLFTNTGANASAIQSEQTARTNADSALATDITTLFTNTGANASAIQTEQTARTNADSALATDITTLTSTVNGNTSAIQSEATTRANADGSLFAQYTVKVDVNGYVSGYGLASTLVNGTPSSSFIVRADSFSVGTPGGTTPAPSLPFIVRTTATTINGVSVPAGVYIQEAFVANGTIGNAKIGNLAVDTAKLDNAAVTSAKIGLLEVKTANIDNATITDAKIANLSAAKLTAGTALAGSITVSGTALSTVQTYANDPAARINAAATTVSAAKLTNNTAIPTGVTVSGTPLSTIQTQAADPAARINAASTTILPGKILISGATTLANWQKAGDTTRIDGGSVSANTITVEKLLVSGSNMIDNGGFQTGDLTAWSPFSSPTNVAVVPVTGANKSKFAIRFVSTGTTTSAFSSNPAYSSPGALEASIRFEGGKRYRVSAEVTGTGTFQIRGYFHNKDGSFNSNTTIISTSMGPNWTEVSGEFVAPAGTIGGHIYLYSLNLNGTQYFTSFAVKEMDAGELLVDGTIKAEKIDTNSFSASGLAVFGGALQSVPYTANSVGWKINNNGSAEFNGVVISRQLQVDTGTFVMPTQEGFDNDTEMYSTNKLYWIETNIPITAWEGTKKTYIPLVGREGSNGTVTAQSAVVSAQPQNVKWGFEAELAPLTRWSGNQRLWINVRAWSQNVTRLSGFVLRWRLMEVT